MIAVTGGSSGIGLALCSMLSDRGAKIVILDIDGKAAQAEADKVW